MNGIDIFKTSEIGYLHKSILNMSKNDFPVDKVTFEIIQAYNYLAEEGTNKKIQEHTAEKELVYLKLIVLQYSSIALFTPREKSPDHFLIASLFAHINNTIVSIINLVDTGLDYQALSLMRNLVELYMLLLTVIESPQKRKAYEQADGAKKSREVWHKYFNKKHFLEMLDTYLNDVDITHRSTYKQWMEDIYSELSSYTHNDYVYLICYDYAVGEDDKNPLNLCGEYVSRKKMVYQYLTKIIFVSELLLNKMLRDENIDIGFKDFFDDPDSPSSLENMELQNIVTKICNYIFMDCMRDNGAS